MLLNITNGLDPLQEGFVTCMLAPLPSKSLHSNKNILFQCFVFCRFWFQNIKISFYISGVIFPKCLREIHVMVVSSSMNSSIASIPFSFASSSFIHRTVSCAWIVALFVFWVDGASIIAIQTIASCSTLLNPNIIPYDFFSDFFCWGWNSCWRNLFRFLLLMAPVLDILICSHHKPSNV